MQYLKQLFENNRRWVEDTTSGNPSFFEDLAGQQSPKYLWIGCADSRVPANQIVGLSPGELFVHRNVANLVVHTDLNCLSVLQYAVDVLKVEHIIVCGHYQCGGVLAALHGQRFGLIDTWLQHIVDVKQKYVDLLDAKPIGDQRADLLCELNVLEQVGNVCQTSIVRDAWSREQPLCVHGWIYDVKDGLLRDLGFTVTGEEDVESAALLAIERFKISGNTR
jgi:carbonic anhydrase